MISIVYLLLYMAAGMQMIRFLLPRKSPLVRGWLGAALGMLLEMQLPALFAWLFGFTIQAHIGRCRCSGGDSEGVPLFAR